MSGMPMAHETIMASSYDVRVVALSIVIATVAAYVALSLGERVTENRGLARHLWLLGGASAMGTGIWSMHFTGMLAFHLHRRDQLRRRHGGAVAGSRDLGIGRRSRGRQPAGHERACLAHRRSPDGQRCRRHALHRNGRDAHPGIRALGPAHRGRIRGDRGRRVARCAVAGVSAAGGIAPSLEMRRAAAAVVMGFAVAGMHYTGMAAATFFATAPQPSNGGVISADALGGGAITVVTLLVLSLALAVAYVDRRFSAHELALAATTSHFHAVFANAPVVLFAFDAAGTITMARGRDAGGTNRYSDEVLGRSFFAVNADAPELLDQARRALAGHEFTADAERGRRGHRDALDARVRRRRRGRGRDRRRNRHHRAPPDRSSASASSLS